MKLRHQCIDGVALRTCIRPLLKGLMVIRYIFKSLAKIKFSSNALIGSGFSCGVRSRCINGSGKKESVTIGDNVEILGSILTQDSGVVNVGSYTTIRYKSVIQSSAKVSVGNFVIISNNVTIQDNNNHPICPSLRLKMSQSGFYSELWRWKYADSSPIKIEDNVWIGFGATVLKGVNIGEGAVVACMSVVTKDVPPYSVVAGNPAKVVKKINQNRCGSL